MGAHKMSPLVQLSSALVLCSALALVSAQQYQCNPDAAGLSDNCIGCICEASTDCKKNTKCINGDSFCGPFLIPRGFWIDAGQCVLDNDSPSDPQGELAGSPSASVILTSHLPSLEEMCPGLGLLRQHNKILYQ